MINTEKQARAIARRCSKENGRPYYAVYEPNDELGDYGVADEYDLETYYYGISENRILGYYVDGERLPLEERDATMTFLDYLTTNLTHQNILDLASNGAAGGFPGLTYYADIDLVYDTFEAEIWEALDMDANDLGYDNTPAFIGAIAGAGHANSGMRNLLVWYMAEREARRYADAVEAA